MVIVPVMRIISATEFPAVLSSLRRPYHDKCYAMYSSLWGGVVTDPTLMVVPVDDHMVHRGDGIFEAFKCVSGSIYNLDAHMDRLRNSAAGLAFQLPWPMQELRRIIVETVRAGAKPDCLVRLLISRGPGSFDVNPYDCEGPQCYVIASRLKAPFQETHPEGAVLCTSSIPAKSGYFATIKNCNYLPNVLMKKEAVDRGADFPVGFDDRDHLTEGATENVGIVTADRVLVFPALDTILCGTTMMRVMELAQTLVQSGELRRAEFRKITRTEFMAAAEILIAGTTPNVAGVRRVDDTNMPLPVPGPVTSRLGRLLADDIKNNARLQTPVL
jgi:branched-subunit amino acid aminotransferase/4-amino-4-deoxychorismate lyase